MIGMLITAFTMKTVSRVFNYVMKGDEERIIVLLIIFEKWSVLKRSLNLADYTIFSENPF